MRALVSARPTFESMLAVWGGDDRSEADWGVEAPQQHLVVAVGVDYHDRTGWRTGSDTSGKVDGGTVDVTVSDAHDAGRDARPCHREFSVLVDPADQLTAV
jgi:hypothetical protein